jgi:hypothetical protein
LLQYDGSIFALKGIFLLNLIIFVTDRILVQPSDIVFNSFIFCFSTNKKNIDGKIFNAINLQTIDYINKNITIIKI